jgi:DNA-binding NarL/FixJ family response regulator
MKVFIAESNFLIRQGLRYVIDTISEAVCVGEVDSSGELITSIINANPDVVFVNYASPLMLDSDIDMIIKTLPHIKVIGITDRPDRVMVTRHIKNGIDGHLLYSCDLEEFTDAIEAVSNNEKFFCGKVLEVIDPENATKTFTCGGIRLSSREIEIIELVAHGLSNKEIADELFISIHTVLTHRKNLMQKLGIKNTAGLVVFAVQNGLHAQLS